MSASIPRLITDLSLEKEWLLATSEAPFIKALATSSLPANNFDNWLIQARPIRRKKLMDRITSPASQSKIRSLIEGGYKSLLQERKLFQSNASNRGLSLPQTTEPNPNPDTEAKDTSFSELKPYSHPWCYQYTEWMMSCTSKKDIPFPNLLLLLWGIEKCYYEAFSNVKHSEAYKSADFDQGYKKFVDWWTSDDFGGYIDQLEEAFGDLVDGEGEHVWDKSQAKEILREMLEHEQKFWASAGV